MLCWLVFVEKWKQVVVQLKRLKRFDWKRSGWRVDRIENQEMTHLQQKKDAGLDQSTYNAELSMKVARQGRQFQVKLVKKGGGGEAFELFDRNRRTGLAVMDSIRSGRIERREDEKEERTSLLRSGQDMNRAEMDVWLPTFFGR